MEFTKAKDIFNALYTDVNGRALSLKWREDHKEADKSFVYGEILPDTFYEIMQTMQPRPGQVFYDLGSGTGKACMLAYLLYPFKKVCGIELVDPLYDASITVQKRFNNQFKPVYEREFADRKLELKLGSFLDADISDADIVFMNSTCFQEPLMEKLEALLEASLQPYTQVMSLSKPLKSPAFQQWKNKTYDFSWGQGTAFFHRKRLWNVYA